MGPDGLDIDALAQQLRHDGIAFDSNNPANWVLEESLLGATDTVSQQGFPQLGVVVVEGTDLQGTQLRDLAQDLNLATGIDTVVVRAPHASAAVSDTLTRSEVEAGQHAMASEPDYAAGLIEFAETSQSFTIPWLPVLVVLLVIVVVVIGATAFFVKR